MAKYNLINNSIFKSLTSSGTGNMSLSDDELVSLYDGNTSSSGIVLSSGDSLWLQADLGNRIKVDDINMYIGSATGSGTVLSGIDVYYKNGYDDIYTLASKSISSGYYISTLPSEAAPRYLMLTVSGINATLYEWEIFNDDYEVAFGSDGQQYASYVGNVPAGDESPVYSLPIYNNATVGDSVNAYVCVEYNGNESDLFVKLSNDEDGEWLGIEDGVLIQDNLESSNYKWEMGTLNGTYVENNKLQSSTSYSESSLITLPLAITGDGLNTGSNSWDYDEVNDKIYVMGNDGAVNNLWEYDKSTNTFTYKSVINPSGASSAHQPVMCYMDNKIYAITNINGAFGYHDLTGAADNWTSLTNVTYGMTTAVNDRISMCCDDTRYIYSFYVDYATTNKSFRRFDTVSGTWSSLSTGYDVYYNYYGSYILACLTYDATRNSLYAIAYSKKLNSDALYIQKYSIGSDSWSTAFLSVDTITGISYSNGCAISYYNDELYVSPDAQWGGKYFKYNVVSGVVTEYSVDYTHADASSTVGSPRILVSMNNALISFLSSNTNKMVDVSYKGSGVYTSPIFKYEDKNRSSYFVIDKDTTNSGVVGVVDDNTAMYVRSSDVEPVDIDELYWDTRLASSSSYKHYITKAVISTGDITLQFIENALANSNSNFSLLRPGAAAISLKDSDVVFVATDARGTHPNPGYLTGYNMNGDLICSYGSNAYTDYITNMEVDAVGYVWGYGYIYYYFRHHRDTGAVISTHASSSVDFLYDLSASKVSEACWYTDKTLNTLYYVDADMSTICSIMLGSPRALTSNPDGTCWVMDEQDSKLKLIDDSGTLLTTISTSSIETPKRLRSDYYGGVWAAASDRVYHIDSDGSVDIEVIISSPNRISTSKNGCAVMNTTTYTISYISKAAKSIIATFSTSTSVHSFGIPAIRSVPYTEDRYGRTPAEYDPVWGTDGSLDWTVVPQNGYLLPKNNYHQIKLDVVASGINDSAVVNKIIMAPAIKISDIAPQHYQPLYYKIVVPSAANTLEYESKLKCWWGVRE